MTKNNWSRDELIVAFNLYCKIPFTKINARYKPVIELAETIGRTPGSVSFKLANFARLDPSLQERNVSGLKNGSKGEELIWNEFNENWNDLSYESELILANYKKEPIEEVAGIETNDLPKDGKEREAIVKIRVNQSFFRKSVLLSYKNRCCITGIEIPELLIASHIIPWSKNTGTRTNPENGLCLNALHDRAFDRGLITLSENMEVKLSDALLKSKKSESIQKYFLPYHNKQIIKPNRFAPKAEYLEYHRANIFIK